MPCRGRWQRLIGPFDPHTRARAVHSEYNAGGWACLPHDMNFPGSFSKIGEIDITMIRSLVERLGEPDWDTDAFRQRRYEVHRDTKTIGLVFDPDFRHSHPTRLPMLETFEPSIRPVLALIANHFERSETGRRLTDHYGLGYFVRATLVTLRSGGVIDEHTDNNFSLVHSHRVHVPIITSNEVYFTVGGETINMRAGEVYEINNRRLHGVRNDGDSARVHLILDFVVPGEQCCCGARRHPDTRCSPRACRDTDQLKVPCICYPPA